RATTESCSGDAQLTLTGRIVMPDGSPAAGAVMSLLVDGGPAKTAEADRAGNFRLRSEFELDCRLHARSADATCQGTHRVPAATARIELMHPIELRLAPARRQVVTVLSEGNP